MLTHDEIRKELHYRDSSFAAIARDLGVTRTHVWEVSKGQSNSERVRTAIADVLRDKFTYREIWGNG